MACVTFVGVLRLFEFWLFFLLVFVEFYDEILFMEVMMIPAFFVKSFGDFNFLTWVLFLFM